MSDDTKKKPTNERFVVVFVEEAHKRGWHGDDCNGNHYGADGFFYELYDTSSNPPRLVGTDGGAPEDQLLVRDWKWVAEELNRLATERAPDLLTAARAAERWISDPDTNRAEEFERIAEEYQRDTGYLRPGKAEPLETGRESSSSENRQRFYEWCQSRNRRVLADLRAAIAKAEGAAPLGSAPPTQNVTAAFVDRLKAMSPDQRLEAFGEMHSTFCVGCGTDVLPCHCRNDE